MRVAIGLALLVVAAGLAAWLDRRRGRHQRTAAEVKRSSFLKDLDPRYRVTQPGPTPRQHKPVQRYPRRIA